VHKFFVVEMFAIDFYYLYMYRVFIFKSVLKLFILMLNY